LDRSYLDAVDRRPRDAALSSQLGLGHAGPQAGQRHQSSRHARTGQGVGPLDPGLLEKLLHGSVSFYNGPVTGRGGRMKEEVQKEKCRRKGGEWVSGR
jgi:hypothetical protein